MEVTGANTDTLKKGPIRTFVAFQASKEAIRKDMINRFLSADKIQHI